jgi:regulator of nucleoside diphosphate kinase
MTMGRDPGILTTRDGYVLDRMLRDWQPLAEEWLALLKRKLSADRLPMDAPVPAGLAVIDARVTFRCASGLTDSRTLCLPRDHVPGGAFLPITTFYGLALLGLREGEALHFDRPEGRHDWVRLEKVLYRPAAPGAPATRPTFRLIAGGLAGRAIPAANENGPGPGPGPSAA